MSDIIINSKYAPGLSTYGVQGNEGKQGKQGYGLYFVPFDINNNLESVINSINNNFYITDNTYKNTEVMLNRTYQVSDTLLSCTGEIWQITNIADGSSTNDTSIECLSKIKSADDSFEKVENYIIPKNCEKLVLTDNTSIFKGDNALIPSSILNIYSSNNNIISIKNDNDNLNLTQTYQIYFDIDAIGQYYYDIINSDKISLQIVKNPYLEIGDIVGYTSKNGHKLKFIITKIETNQSINQNIEGVVINE